MKSIFGSFDFYFTIANFIAYIFYFAVLIFIKKLRRRSYFQIHHVNFVGLLISLLAVVWSIEMYPFEANKMPNYVCFLFELSWATLKYTRVYAVLILASYRYVAVFKFVLFKRVKKSLKHTIISGLVAWVFPLVWYFIIKYATEAVPYGNCVDGYNPRKTLAILYQALTFLMGFLVPTLGIIYLSIATHLKVFESIKKVSINSLPIFSNKNTRFKKEYFFIMQIYVINTIEILIFTSMIILYIASQIPGMFNRLTFAIMNVVPIFLSTCIPLIMISSICINTRHLVRAA